MKYNVDNTYYVIAEFITIVTEYKSNAQIYSTQNGTESNNKYDMPKMLGQSHTDCCVNLTRLVHVWSHFRVEALSNISSLLLAYISFCKQTGAREVSSPCKLLIINYWLLIIDYNDEGGYIIDNELLMYKAKLKN